MGILEYVKRLEQYRPAFKTDLSNLVSLLLLEISREYVTRLYSSGSNGKYTRSMKQSHRIGPLFAHNYSSKLTGKQIESEFEISFDHLNRAFKKIFEQTIFSYLSQIRINHAKDLLAQTPVYFRFTYMIGFEDSSYFTKFFKQHNGTTPSQYWRFAHQDERT